jgi:hypothetical protein
MEMETASASASSAPSVKYTTYVIHSKELVDRVKKVEEIQSKFSDVKVVSSVVVDDVTDEMIKFNVEPIKNPAYDLNPRMNKREFSICMNHRAAIEEAIAESPRVSCLFMEDDCMFNDNIIEQLEKELELFEASEFDAMYLNVSGNKSDSELSSIDTTTVIIPVTNAYVIKTTSLTKIYEHMKDIKYAYPKQLAYALMTSESKTCISTKQIIVDGSKYGGFLSFVSDNTILPINPAWTEIYSHIVEKKVREDKYDAHFEKIDNDNVHPAMLFLKGLYAMECQKDYVLAKDCMDKVYNFIKINGYTLDGRHLFMKKYVELFKYLQKLPESSS